ncbi:MAG: hypothetical protein FWD55_09215 [Propionibacteriaceae bacterium]|nr:hypothetical protein [Propionibacteriaceae bacterium]
MTMYQNYQPPTTRIQGSTTDWSPYGHSVVAGELEPFGVVGRPAPVRADLPEHPEAITVLILGVLSFGMMGILGPIAWIMGNKAKRQCEAGQYRMSDALSTGRILGIVGSVLAIVAVVLLGGMVLLSLLADMFFVL